MILHIHVSALYRYSPKIPEPAPSWSRHGAEFGGLWLFPIIKIIVVHQACNTAYVTCMYCDMYVRQISRKIGKAREDRERFYFAFIYVCVVGKNPNTPNWALWLMTPLHGVVLETPLHGVVLEVWDLWCISVIRRQHSLIKWTSNGKLVQQIVWRWWWRGGGRSFFQKTEPIFSLEATIWHKTCTIQWNFVELHISCLDNMTSKLQFCISHDTSHKCICMQHSLIWHKSGTAMENWFNRLCKDRGGGNVFFFFFSENWANFHLAQKLVQFSEIL